MLFARADDNDIGGVVTGANGPEAGVWVIAETNELPTQYAKMVVTDVMKIPDQSQFGGKSNIPEKLTQVDWLKQMKNIGCIGCHQLGQEFTRTIPCRPPGAKPRAVHVQLRPDPLAH